MTKKGFDTFVKGILNAKPIPKKQAAKSETKREDIKQQRQPELDDAGLLALLNQGTEGPDAGPRGTPQSKEKMERNEVSAMARIAKLKSQYTGGKEHAMKLAQSSQQQTQNEKTKADLHSKKKSVNAKEQLILDRDERKRELKLKLKQRQQNPSSEVGEAPAESEIPKEKVHFKKRMLKKTRSKQKNKRKDNRSPEEIARKLLEKGIELRN